MKEEHKQLVAKLMKSAMQKITNTDRISFDVAIDAVHDFQELILKTAKTPIVIVDNPFEGWFASQLIFAGYPVKGIVEKMKEFLSQKLRWETVPYADKEGEYLMGNFFHARMQGSFDAFSPTSLRFLHEAYNVPYSAEFLKKIDVVEKLHELGNVYFIPDKVAIVCQKPLKFQFDEQNRRHNSVGPQMEYAGFYPFRQYYMNGVEVPDWLANTHSSEIDISRYKEISNADVKAEFLRKVGIERMLETGKQIDSYENYPDKDWWQKSEYELWDMSHLFVNIPFAPHLKMKNQTTGVWHVEAVSPDCNNLEKALAYRLGQRTLNIVGIA